MHNYDFKLKLLVIYFLFTLSPSTTKHHYHADYSLLQHPGIHPSTYSRDDGAEGCTHLHDSTPAIKGECSSGIDPVLACCRSVLPDFLTDNKSILKEIPSSFSKKGCLVTFLSHLFVLASA